MAKVLAVYVTSYGQNYQMAFLGQPEVLNACISHKDVIGTATMDDGEGNDVLVNVIIPWESVIEFQWGYIETEDPEPEPVVDAFCEVTE